MFLFQETATFAQENLQTDSIPEKEGKVKFMFAFDARRSFVLKHRMKFNGVKIGLNIRDKYKLGLGFYGMKEPILLPGVRMNKDLYPDATDTVSFHFDYSSLFYEPVWFKSKRWEITSPFQLGVGALKLSYLDTTGVYNEFQRGGAPVFGVSGSAEYKLLRWLALDVGLGYRFLVLKDQKVRRSVSAPIYSFSVKILAGELFKMVFRRKTLEDW